MTKIDVSRIVCQKKSPGGMIRPGREASKLNEGSYLMLPMTAIDFTASWRKNRNFLRLLGCSRQDVAVQARKRRSFSGIVPPAPINPVHELPRGADARLIGERIR